MSLPFNPNSGSPVWTTYTYDASGRTLTVTTAGSDTTGTTTTSYSGNTTTVTDAASKWKKSTVDVFGNLTTVTEPNPAGGTDLTTTYTYNDFNQLTQVTMRRCSVTQNRYFTYLGSDMISTTNPENGTVSYTYDNSHRVTGRTDGKGQKTQYDHDVYGRVTEVRHYPNGTTEDATQRVDYTYDAGTNGNGHLTGVTVAGTTGGFGQQYVYSYGYNQAGRVISCSRLL